MAIIRIGTNTGDDINAGEDTKLQMASPLTERGSATDIEVSKYSGTDDTHALVRFDLSSVPAGAILTDGRIRLKTLSTSGGDATYTIGVRRMLKSWPEATTTWSYRYGTADGYTEAWAGAGATGSADRNSTIEVSVQVPDASEVYYSFGLTTAIQAMLSGSVSNYGFHFERTDGSGENFWRVFYSKENSDGSRPYMLLTYTLGLSPTSVVSAGGWTVSGAADIPTAIGDSSSTSYIKSGASTPDPITLQMPSLATPAGSVTIDVTARVGS